MICINCTNFQHYKIVPSHQLCVKCYNLKQFAKGEPYVCNNCAISCLRVYNYINCEVCNSIKKDLIPQINTQQQVIYHNALQDLKATYFKKKLETFREKDEQELIEIYNSLSEEQKELLSYS